MGSHRRSAFALWLGFLLTLKGLCYGQELRLESVGGRFGFYPFGAGSRFYQAEAFGNVALPLNWGLGRQWSLQPRMDSSAGWLGDKHANAFIGTVGPTLLFQRQNLPISFEGGLSATILSRSDFPDKNFGQLLQFTSHVGVNFDFATHFRLSYRFQHMSDAGLSSHNPGLNMHVFGASYLF